MFIEFPEQADYVEILVEMFIECPEQACYFFSTGNILVYYKHEPKSVVSYTYK